MAVLSSESVFFMITFLDQGEILFFRVSGTETIPVLSPLRPGKDEARY